MTPDERERLKATYDITDEQLDLIIELDQKSSRLGFGYALLGYLNHIRQPHLNYFGIDINEILDSRTPGPCVIIPEPPADESQENGR